MENIYQDYLYEYHFSNFSEYNISEIVSDKQDFKDLKNKDILNAYFYDINSLPSPDEICYGKLFCIAKTDDDISQVPFAFTILLGQQALSKPNVLPDICHYYKKPYCIKFDNYLLREFTISDFDILYNIFHTNTSSFNSDFMLGNYNVELNNFTNELSSYSLLNCGMYGIFNKKELIGYISIHYKQLTNNYELSYYIDIKYRHNGIAKKYIIILINFFYETHDEDTEIYCTINTSNHSSIKTALSVGFNLKSTINNVLIYSNK